MVKPRQGFDDGWGFLWTTLIIVIVFLLIGLTIAKAVQAEERFFAVKATNEWGESDFSEEVNADVPSGHGVTVQWNKSEGADGYIIFWGKASGDYIPPDGITIADTDNHIFVRPAKPANVTLIE